MQQMEPEFSDGGDQALVRFTFEMGQLREEARHGWLRINENPESVAEHTQRAACLGYILAIREKFDDPCLVVTMIIFHDMHEVRTGDADIVQRKYMKLDEDRAAFEQVSDMGEVGKTIYEMWQDVDQKRNQAGIIAKDAEILEMVFTARELVAKGNHEAQAWIDSTMQRLKTESGKALLEIVNQADPCQWWKDLQAEYCRSIVNK